VDESAEIQELLVQLLTVLTPELAADLAAESPETFEKLQQVLKELHPEAAERLGKSDSDDEGGVHRFYHITDNPNFKIDPNFTPEDNSISIHDRSGRKGLYVAPDVEGWVNGHGYARPFVAEIHVPKHVLEDKSVQGRWGGERFIPGHLHDQIKVHRVVPIDAIAREQFGQHGWFESEAGKEFDTGKQITAKPWEHPFKGYKYSGKDVRDMSADEVVKLKESFEQGYKARLGKSEDLEKGKSGNWQDEGITLQHWQDRHGYHNVAAADRHNNEIGYASFAYDLVPDEHETHLVNSPTHLRGWDVYVAPEHRRKGIATAMYQLAEEKSGRKVLPSGVLTPDGEQFTAARLKKSDDHQARFVRALHEVAREHHLDQRDKAYWQCNDFSHAAKRVADEHGVPAELWSSTINFDQDNGEIKAGETVAHTFLKIGDQFHDYTASQATAALPHPFVGSKPSRYHLDPEKKPDALQDVSAAHSDPGSKFWYDAINAKMGGLKKAELEKGSMRRKAPFDPRTALTDTERDHMADWQGGPAIEGRPFHREQLTRMEGNARVRALHRLSGVAQTKLVDGKRLFLLHRGMSPQEHDMTVRDGRIERPWSHSSWTPRESLANNFANPYIKNPGKLVSAWIHEDDIHTIPKQFGGVDAEYAAAAGHQKNRLANEHEVVVRAGHSSEIHQVRTAEKPTSWSSDHIHDAPRNLDDKINIKGAQEQKDRKLFGKSDVLKNLQALQKSLTERLEKTRGRIVMPGLSNMTRPDQQIRTIATPRQEKIAARVLTNQTIPGASADNKAALSNVIRDHHI
jgi:GNAT superfamily N-acetyltransferase